ncbi:MAG: ribulose-phosphate 3-epimerase [Planctomycetota bacterium]|nr:ribulose-phosphate 3-epimerase [Planctomycetota bacterium]
MTIQPDNPWKSLGSGPLIAPSLLACDFTRVGEQIAEAVAAGAEVLHVDIMDGHFVPNLSMGPGFVKSIRAFTDCTLDVHIMVDSPAYFAERFAEAGANSITFHIEATDKPREIIDFLHDQGLGAGISVKPTTPAKVIEDIIEAVDLVLVMTVEPGYGGQKFMQEQLPKIEQVRSMLGDEQRLQVDGGIDPVTARLCAVAGADVFVAGENIFGSGDIERAITILRNEVTEK